MTRAVLYPIKAEPVLPESLRPEQPPTPLTWFAAASEPVRLVPLSLAALLATGVFVGEPGDFPVVYDPQGMQWFQPASEPTPPKAGLHVSLQLASTVDADLLTQPETLHVDRWFVAPSEPVRVVAKVNVGPSFTVAPLTYDPQGMQWWRPASEPTPPKAGLHASLQLASVVDADLLTQPETLHVDRWFYPASEPMPPKLGLHSSLRPASVIDADLLTQPETLHVDRWFAPASEPVRVTPRSLAAVLADGAFVAEPSDFAAPAYDPSELQWFRPAVVPAAPKLGLHASLQQASAIDADLLTQPETLHVDRWFVPASEPVRVVPPINVGPSAVIDPTTLLQRISVDKWFAPASEPVPPKPSLHVSLLPAGVFVGEPSDLVAPFEPAGLQWFRPAVQPHGAWTPAYTWVYSSAVATIDRPLVSQWFKPVEEPVRGVPRSLAALLSDGAFVAEPSDFAGVPIAAPPKHEGLLRNIGRLMK